jgi:hypothetical protein
VIQGTLVVIQGISVVIQGTLVVIQGTLVVIQGTSTLVILFLFASYDRTGPCLPPVQGPPFMEDPPRISEP